MDDNTELTRTHLTSHQAQLLIAMYLASDSTAAYELIHRSAVTSETSKALSQMDFIVIGGNRHASVTPAGGEYLLTNGFLDKLGSPTELGQQLYRDSTKMLNEVFSLLKTLF